MVGKTLAIIGFGKVGSEVGRRAKGLGFNVLAYDPYASEAKAAALGVKLVPLDEALATADFFSLHMPMTPATKAQGREGRVCGRRRDGRRLRGRGREEPRPPRHPPSPPP